MKATDLLKSQHREVSELFQQIEDAADPMDKLERFEELATRLVAHDTVEREVFYPACEEALQMIDPLGEALVEHGMVEFALYKADQNKNSAAFDHYLYVLKLTVEQHVLEEEEELLTELERALAAEELHALGEEMEARYADALVEDFRGPLFDNLQEVLAGALKTSPVQHVGEDVVHEVEPVRSPARTIRTSSAKLRSRLQH